MNEYKIVTDSYPARLAYWVNKELKDGWHLVGGVAVISTPGNTEYSQAMSREVDGASNE